MVFCFFTVLNSIYVKKYIYIKCAEKFMGQSKCPSNENVGQAENFEEVGWGENFAIPSCDAIFNSQKRRLKKKRVKTFIFEKSRTKRLVEFDTHRIE